jgi:hypothetical protein
MLPKSRSQACISSCTVLAYDNDDFRATRCSQGDRRSPWIRARLNDEQAAFVLDQRRNPDSLPAHPPIGILGTFRYSYKGRLVRRKWPSLEKMVALLVAGC